MAFFGTSRLACDETNRGGFFAGFDFAFALGLGFFFGFGRFAAGRRLGFGAMTRAPPFFMARRVRQFL